MDQELEVKIQQARQTAERCLLGSSTPNGIHDLPDIFWLMGWADWAVEEQLMTEMLDRRIHYVVGFAFTPDRQEVLLIEKQKPEWQRGLLNGLGGKLEPGETYLQAMIREYREECGLEILEWKEIAVLDGPEVVVSFFAAVTDKLSHAYSTTNEKVLIVHCNHLQYYKVVPNLNWMIPLCRFYESHLDGFQIRLPIQVKEEAVDNWSKTGSSMTSE